MCIGKSYRAGFPPGISDGSLPVWNLGRVYEASHPEEEAAIRVGGGGGGLD